MPFAPGQSGNPAGGKPTQKAFFEMLRIAVTAQGQSGAPKLREVAEKLVDQALAGEGWAIREIADRIDGKVPQQIGSDPENPLTLVGTINMIAYQQPLITHDPDSE